MAPSYMSTLIKPKAPSLKDLRGDEDYFQLSVPPVPCLKQTERSFSHCAPTVWNGLPYKLRTLSDIKVFKSELKMHLFQKACDG